MNCTCWMVDLRKTYFKTVTLSEVLFIADLQHGPIRIYIHAESEFRLSLIKFGSAVSHYTTSLQCTTVHNNMVFRNVGRCSRC